MKSGDRTILLVGGSAAVAMGLTMIFARKWVARILEKTSRSSLMKSADQIDLASFLAFFAAIFTMMGVICIVVGLLS